MNQYISNYKQLRKLEISIQDMVEDQALEVQNQIDQLRKLLGLTDNTNCYKVIRKQLVCFKKSILVQLIQNQKIIQVTIIDVRQKKIYDKLLIELMNMDVKMNINFQSHDQKVLYIVLLIQVEYIQYKHKLQFLNSE